VPDFRQSAEDFGRALGSSAYAAKRRQRQILSNLWPTQRARIRWLGKPHAFSERIMLNQFNTTETNLGTRLDTKHSLRRLERLGEKSGLRSVQSEQHREQVPAAPLPPESVYFIIELA
jgi:hypothetical protein